MSLGALPRGGPCGPLLFAVSNEPLSAILTQLVGRALEQEQPENVDPAGTTLTGEGPEVEIVIVPHRDLGGISLVAWTDQYDARLLWANVGDLSTHDDLDLGVVVARIRYEDDWRRRLGEALAAELVRPIHLRSQRGLFGAPRVECWIEAAWKNKRIGVLRPSRSLIGAETEMTTSLAGGPGPPFSLPPDISNG